MIKILVATTSQRFDESDHPQIKILMPKIGPPAICFNNKLRPFLYMRVATLSRTTLPKPWTVLAFATLALVLAGATALDTDRSELSEVSTKHYVSVNDQSANVNENSAQGTVVLNTVVSGTPTGCTIGNGNTDQDGDGNVTQEEIAAYMAKQAEEQAAAAKAALDASRHATRKRDRHV